MVCGCWSNRFPYPTIWLKLHDWVKQALRKYGEEIKEIVAVPPFVSRDLTYEHDHLKSAFARLAEQVLLEQPGLLVVELEEAKAIAAEADLTGDEVHRPLTLYLLGQYRHDGSGDGLKVQLSVKVMRGKKLLAEIKEANVDPDEIDSVVRKAATSLVEQTLGIRTRKLQSTQVEARQLARRAESFLLTGGWHEAAALCEAGLLFEPRDRGLLESALTAYARLIAVHRAHGTPIISVEYNKRLKLAMKYYLRALEHLEFTIQSGMPVNFSLTRSESSAGELRYSMNWDGFVKSSVTPEDAKVFARSIRRRELEMLVRMMQIRAAAGHQIDSYFASWIVAGREPKEKYELLLRLVRELHKLPGTKQRTIEISKRKLAANYLDSADGHHYLLQLAAIDDQEVQAAVRSLWKDIENRRHNLWKQPQIGTIPASSGKQRVQFKPVKLTWLTAEGKPAMTYPMRGVEPVGEDIDLVWGADLFVMKQKGTLRQIWLPGVQRS